MLEGLHPVFLALFMKFRPLSFAKLSLICKAGLLASPPVQRPSHYVITKQWHTRPNEFPFPAGKGRGYSGGTTPDFNGIPF
jgi:hypothetical protein